MMNRKSVSFKELSSAWSYFELEDMVIGIKFSMQRIERYIEPDGKFVAVTGKNPTKPTIEIFAQPTVHYLSKEEFREMQNLR